MNIYEQMTLAFRDAFKRFRDGQRKLVTFLPYLKAQLAEYYGCLPGQVRTFPHQQEKATGDFPPDKALHFDGQQFWHFGLGIQPAGEILFHLVAESDGQTVFIKVNGWNIVFGVPPDLQGFLDALYGEAMQRLAVLTLDPDRHEPIRIGFEQAAAAPEPAEPD
jgi:hypothetical protein